MARKPRGLELEAGTVVDGYVVERVVAQHGDSELTCDAVGADGAAVTLVVGWRRTPDRHEWIRIRRLARRRARLQHDALLPVWDLGDHSGRPYLALERYPETSFDDLLDGSPLPAARVLHLLAPVGEALDLAHAHSVVHQRLSGTSLLVEGDALLLDGFGLAGGPRKVTFELVAAHDPRYSPPEELRGEPLEPASNVYSLAALLVHALTGVPPFEGARTAQAYGHLMEGPPRPSERVPQLGAAFDGVIARAMAKDSARRPASASELLDQAAAALGVTVRVEGEEAPARPRRVATLAALAAVVLAAAAGVAAGLVLDPFEATGASPTGSGADARALGRLDGERTLLRARLSRARTPQREAAAAAGRAEVYGRTAGAAGSPRLVSAARAAERAYQELGAAAEAGSAQRFAAAGDAVGLAEARLAAAARAPR
jgi:hypothetical protein